MQCPMWETSLDVNILKVLLMWIFSSVHKTLTFSDPACLNLENNIEHVLYCDNGYERDAVQIYITAV